MSVSDFFNRRKNRSCPELNLGLWDTGFLSIDGTIDTMTMWNSVPLIRMVNKMRALAKEASQKESQSV